MQIVFREKLVDPGVAVRDVPFGTVVRRTVSADQLYLLVSGMDGSGHRELVTLGSGSVKRVAQDTRVIPVENAVLYVGGGPLHEDLYDIAAWKAAIGSVVVGMAPFLDTTTLVERIAECVVRNLGGKLK